MKDRHPMAADLDPAYGGEMGAETSANTETSTRLKRDGLADVLDLDDLLDAARTVDVEALDRALLGMVRTSWPMDRDAYEKGWNEAIHAARERVRRTVIGRPTVVR